MTSPLLEPTAATIERQLGSGVNQAPLMQLRTANIMIGRELVNEGNFRVLAALDSSDAAFAALQILGPLLEASALDVTLMHVIEMPWADVTTSHLPGEDSDMAELSEYQVQLEKELRRNADIAVSRAQRYLERLQIPSTTIIE
jgi:hypothetical protein